MAECTHCRATLAPGARWCWRCYTPVHDQPAAVHEPENPPSGLRIAPGVLPTRPKERIVIVPDTEATSMWLAGVTTFGTAGKVVVSALFGALGLLLAWFAGELVGRMGAPGGAFALFVFGLYVPLAIIVLRNVWRAERPMRATRVSRERIVYAEGPVVRVTGPVPGAPAQNGRTTQPDQSPTP